MKTKFFLYARKSTEDEERQVMSIEAQLAELAEYAKRENIEIAETFIESKSAKKPGREIFNQMMSKVHDSKEPIGLIAWHPDRLARNSIDGGQIIYLIDIGRIASLRFPTFWFEPTPQGLFMLQVAFGQSKYYSDNLSENVKGLSPNALSSKKFQIFRKFFQKVLREYGYISEKVFEKIYKNLKFYAEYGIRRQTLNRLMLMALNLPRKLLAWKMFCAKIL